MPELSRYAEVAIFQDLPKYSRSQVALLNVHCSLFGRVSLWKTWVEDALRELLEVPSGRRLDITQSSEFQGEQVQKYMFEQKELSIGRAADTDISLPQRSISRRHARIVEREDGFYIEDMESSSGTYVNRQRLKPGNARLLVRGDEVLIFPYVLRMDPQEIWTRDSGVEVSYSSRFTPTAAPEFIRTLGSDLSLFQFRIHPEVGYGVLAISRLFLTNIVARLTRDIISELAAADSGLLEYVVVNILAKANRELQFPFQCFLVPSSQFGLQDEPGIALEASVRMSDAQGSILLFLPDSGLKRFKGTSSSKPPRNIRELITVRVMVCIGLAEGGAGQVMDIVPSDTLLYVPRVEVIVPCGVAGLGYERGWIAVQNESDPNRFELRELFERSVDMDYEINADAKGVDEEVEVDGRLNMADLPIRIHVVLSQIDLSLKELEALSEGSIIELDKNRATGEVQLVANGKVLGGGELVKIDEQLGVQINRWGRT